MFMPPGSSGVTPQWVPISDIIWGWGGYAYLDGNNTWQSLNCYATPPSRGAYPAFPTWLYNIVPFPAYTNTPPFYLSGS
jgi:hypothetical protein